MFIFILLIFLYSSISLQASPTKIIPSIPINLQNKSTDLPILENESHEHINEKDKDIGLSVKSHVHTTKDHSFSLNKPNLPVNEKPLLNIATEDIRSFSQGAFITKSLLEALAGFTCLAIIVVGGVVYSNRLKVSNWIQKNSFNNEPEIPAILTEHNSPFLHIADSRSSVHESDYYNTLDDYMESVEYILPIQKMPRTFQFYGSSVESSKLSYANSTQGLGSSVESCGSVLKANSDSIQKPASILSLNSFVSDSDVSLSKYLRDK